MLLGLIPRSIFLQGLISHVTVSWSSVVDICVMMKKRGILVDTTVFSLTGLISFGATTLFFKDAS